MVDFTVIVLSSIVALLALELAVNVLHLSGASQGYFESLTTVTTTYLTSTSRNNLSQFSFQHLGYYREFAW
jgi:hypothetical protein